MENKNWYEDNYNVITDDVADEKFNDVFENSYNTNYDIKNNSSKKKIGIKPFVCGILAAAVLGIGIGTMFSGTPNNNAIESRIEYNNNASKSENSESPSANMLTTLDSETNDSLAQTISNCVPSIVGIDIQMTSTSFFGQQQTATASGSGVIITSDGYIATNNHVIEGATKITVYLQDGTTYDAQLIGADAKTDLAVIKIDATGLKPATLGTSSTLMVGETAIAIGNPLGQLMSTATKGIISALDRTITVEGQDMTLLQTDAAINSGNSGGGLFNAKGQLIGIVNAKSMGLSVEGLGFAIPIDTAKSVIADLMDKGFVSGRPYIGISADEVAVRYNSNPFYSYFQQTTTVLQITAVESGSSADIAGLKVNDYLLAINGKSISSKDELTSIINNCKIGDTITITIQRDGNNSDIQVVLRERNSK